MISSRSVHTDLDQEFLLKIMICYWGIFIDSSGTSVSMDVLHRLPGEKGGLTKSLFVSQAEELAVF